MTVTRPGQWPEPSHHTRCTGLSAAEDGAGAVASGAQGAASAADEATGGALSEGAGAVGNAASEGAGAVGDAASSGRLFCVTYAHLNFRSLLLPTTPHCRAAPFPHTHVVRSCLSAL